MILFVEIIEMNDKERETSDVICVECEENRRLLTEMYNENQRLTTELKKIKKINNEHTAFALEMLYGMKVMTGLPADQKWIKEYETNRSKQERKERQVMVFVSLTLCNLFDKDVTTAIVSFI